MKQVLLIGEFGDATALAMQQAAQAIATASNCEVQFANSPVKIAERWVEFDAVENAEVSPSALTLDSDIESVLGIRLDSLNLSQLVLRGSIGINISGKEAIMKGYFAKGLYASEHVDPNNRHYSIGFPIVAGSKNISLTYTDTANAAAPFGSGYKVRLVMLCKLKQA